MFSVYLWNWISFIYTEKYTFININLNDAPGGVARRSPTTASPGILL